MKRPELRDPGNFHAMRALIDGAGSLVIGSHIRWMKDAGYFVVATDIVEDFVGRHLADRGYCTPPYTEEEACAETLNQIIDQERINLIIPIVDEGLPFWAARREELAFQNVFAPVSAPESIAIANDKWRSFEFLRSIQVPTPRTAQEWEEGLMLTKPRFGRGSTGVALHCDVPVENVPGGYLYQEHIEGQEYTVDLLCDEPGRCVYTVVRHRVKTESGVSVMGEVVCDEEIADAARTIARELEIFGPANVQCIRNHKGAFFIDLNLRTSGGQALSLKATENWYSRYADMAARKDLIPVPVQTGLKIFRSFNETFADL